MVAGALQAFWDLQVIQALQVIQVIQVIMASQVMAVLAVLRATQVIQVLTYQVSQYLRHYLLAGQQDLRGVRAVQGAVLFLSLQVWGAHPAAQARQGEVLGRPHLIAQAQIVRLGVLVVVDQPVMEAQVQML
jgi:hypothetical protein